MTVVYSIKKIHALNYKEEILNALTENKVCHSLCKQQDYVRYERNRMWS